MLISNDIFSRDCNGEVVQTLLSLHDGEIDLYIPALPIRFDVAARRNTCKFAHFFFKAV